jgi:hypothetical protein
MKGWWDYAIADELHQLAQEPAQGNNLGVLYRCAHKLIGPRARNRLLNDRLNPAGTCSFFCA